MKKKIIILSTALFFGAIFFTSCHKKRGIVPCPSYGQMEIENNIDAPTKGRKTLA